MTSNSLIVSFEELKKLLIEAELFKCENTTRRCSVKNDKFSQEFLSVMFDDDYERIYKVAMKNDDYDFILSDDSFLQFSIQYCNSELDKIKIRYAYYPSPREYLSYEEFLKENGISFEECGYGFFEEYEQYISESRLKKSVTPIRYDYDVDEYTSVTHPISHLHIGMVQNFRIPSLRILEPQAFVIFVVRNMYYNNWIKLLSSEKYSEILDKSKKDKHLLRENFDEDEKKYLFIV